MLSRKKSKDFFAVFDISSGSVAGAHIQNRFKLEDKLLVAACVRSEMLVQEDIKPHVFLNNMISKLDEVINRVQKANSNIPEFTQVILSAPWYFLKMRTITHQKTDGSFVCTKKLVESLVAEHITGIVSELSSKKDLFDQDYIVVEKQLSNIKLNGYAVESPYGKKASSLEFSLIVTLTPKIVFDKITQSIRRAYATRKVGFTTTHFSTLVVLRNIKNMEESVIIDVGEEITDVSFIKKNTLIFEHSFPLGTFGLYKILSEKKNFHINESIALLESFRLQKLTPTISESIEKIINTFSEDWQKNLRQLIEISEYGFCLPAQIVILGDPRFEILLTQAIESDPFIRYSCAHTKPQVSFVNEALISSDIKNIDETPLDVPVAMAALFVQEIL